MSEIHLLQGDCLDILPTLPDGCADAIITDLPYGTTACKWDVIIPFEPMWEQVKRLCKGAFVTTASQPFTSVLIGSNMGMYKYSWYWHKNIVSGFQLAKIQPTRAMEEICVFYSKQPTYNPQPTESIIRDRKRVPGAFVGNRTPNKKNEHRLGTKPQPNYYPEFVAPRNVLEIPCVPRATGTLHPTQKPVALYEYLIKTYTNPGDTVLDFCMGSGTTGVAAVKTGRNFIGIEKEGNYFEIASRRINGQPANEAGVGLEMLSPEGNDGIIPQIAMPL
jgi:site-specific DNA-methyltransferase (adenine-specific)